MPTPLPTTSPTASAPLVQWLDLVWGTEQLMLGSWREAIDSWSRAWTRAVAPWPWLVPPVAQQARTRDETASRPTHVRGTTIDRLRVGDQASVTKRFTQADIDAFARISGDDNPAHVDAEWAARSPFKGRLAHGLLTAGLVSAVLGTRLPGPGSIYMSQSLRWLAPVRPGDVLTATATVKEIMPEKGRVVLETVVTRGEQIVLTGEALVKPPAAPAARPKRTRTPLARPGGGG
jgi:3-hydroxybutyryl-CoA dehydratase